MVTVNSFHGIARKGRNHGWKVKGTKVWVPTPPRSAKGRAGVCAGIGRPLSWWGYGYHTRQIFENSDAKSCILVTTTLISGLPRTCIFDQTTSMSRAKSVPKFQIFLKTTAKNLVDQFLPVPAVVALMSQGGASAMTVVNQ